MDRVQSALAWAVRELSQRQVDSPRMTAELLLGHIQGWNRVRVLTHPGSPLSPETVERFASMVRRRAGGEPLQYIIGEQEFYGLQFRVTPAVLIPRPETEILVENAVAAARSLGPRRLRFADVGTGSGCIAVSFARHVPLSVGWATDISVDALAVARENAARNGVLKQIGFMRADFLEGFAPHPHFDLVLSNPPYVAAEDAAALPAQVREHEPAVALFSGSSGLDSYRRLIPQAIRRLVPGGGLLLEIGAGMSEQVSLLLEEAAFAVENIARDLQGIPRCILARRGHG
jgi:release factor glutamine methyltransferase